MFFFSSESECFLEMGLDMNRLRLQLRGGPARCPNSARPTVRRINTKPTHRKRKVTNKCKTKQGKMTTFV